MQYLISGTILASMIVAVTCAVLILSSEIESPEVIQLKREAMYNAAEARKKKPAPVVEPANQVLLSEHGLDTCKGTHLPH